MDTYNQRLILQIKLDFISLLLQDENDLIYLDFVTIKERFFRDL